MDAAIGACMVIAGICIYRFAEPLDRALPAWHMGSPLVVRIMGLHVVGFGIIWIAIGIARL